MILQSLEELERELRKEPFPRVFLIIGPEQYQCRKAAALVRNRVLTPEMLAFDCAEFVAGETRMEEIIEAANTFPMVSKRRVVFVSAVERLEKDEKEDEKEKEEDVLLAAIPRLSPRTVLVLVAQDLDRRRKLYKTLRDEICVAEFPHLKDDRALGAWAEAFVRKEGYRISPASIKKIVRLAGTDIQNLAAELEKLILYAGDAKEVPEKAVDDLVRENRQQRIFDLTDAIGRRDRNAALKSLANLMSTGEPALVVVIMMARHCRQVLIAQEGLRRRLPAREIGSTAQIPPFKLDEFLRQARTANAAAVRGMFIKLAGIDRKLKSTPADGRTLIESLICELV